jgi:hypothetical protein
MNYEGLVLLTGLEPVPLARVVSKTTAYIQFRHNSLVLIDGFAPSRLSPADFKTSAFAISPYELGEPTKNCT